MSDQLPVGHVAISQVAPMNVRAEAVAANTVTTARFKTLEEMEVEHIEKALSFFENNKSKAAQALGVTVKTLYNKLHYYGLFEKYASAK